MANTPKRQESLGGRLPCKSLFVQYSKSGIYDLDNFKKIFLAIGDIYEYQAALKLVGSWDEWQRLKRDWPTFHTIIKTWIVELSIMQKSEAALKIIKMSKVSNAQGLSAAKWIAEGHHSKAAKQQNKVGRPQKKVAVRQDKRLSAQERRAVEEEALRIADAQLK